MSNLTRYNQGASDRNNAAHDESLFGHLVEEQGWTVKEALENLSPIAKFTYSQTVSVANTSKWLAVAGGVIGLLAGGTVGLVGALPIGAAALAFFAYREADRCVDRREVELKALKNCPSLLDLMYGCHLKGIDTRNLIAAWDLFLDSYAEAGSADANLMAREYLRILDGLCFTVEGAPMPQESPAPLPQVQPTIANQPAPIPPDPDQPVMQRSAAIQNDTRLNAIAVPSVPVQQPVQNKPNDIADLILAQGNSLVFIGGQGVGKSRLMSIASRVGLQTGRYRHVTVLSSLAKANEDPHYWKHAQTQTFCDMGSMGQVDRAKALRAFLNSIQQFKRNANDQNPGLLIVDEIAYLAALLADSPKDDLLSKELEIEIQDVIRVVSSGGAKRGWFVWFGTPQGAIGDLGNIGTGMKKFQPVLCAISPGDTATSRGNAVTWDTGLYNAARKNFPSLVLPGAGMSDRIVFFQDSWMPQTCYPAPEEIDNNNSTPSNSKPLSAVLLNRSGLGESGAKK